MSQVGSCCCCVCAQLSLSAQHPRHHPSLLDITPEACLWCLKGSWATWEIVGRRDSLSLSAFSLQSFSFPDPLKRLMSSLTPTDTQTLQIFDWIQCSAVKWNYFLMLLYLYTHDLFRVCSLRQYAQAPPQPWMKKACKNNVWMDGLCTFAWIYAQSIW